MRLSELVAELDRPAVEGVDRVAAVEVIDTCGDLSSTVEDVHHDSRTVVPGSLFACVPGEHTDGHDHADAAVAAGVTALLVTRRLDLEVAQIVVDDVRAAMAIAAAAVHGWPSRSLTVVGITGTNGKTTVAQLVQAIVDAAGRSAAVLGTLTGARTTPEAPDLQRWLADRVADGTDVVAMEVSSHALSQNRVLGTRFAVAVFTNLSRDHLDYHHTMEEYFRAKASLFDPACTERAVINVDSPEGRRLRDAVTIPVVGFSMEQAEALELGVDGSRFRWRGQEITLGLGGRFNVMNALAAAEVGVLLGVGEKQVAAGLSQPIAVPGRLERVVAGQAFTVIVDYAHTPDGLEQVLRALGELVVAGERVHVVFGCGGDRDPSKRAPMGEVAARLADRVVLTADNSRGESTGAIIADLRRGFESTPAAERRATELLVEPDRRAGIAAALGAAEPGDVVLIAGKGHESTQTIGSKVLHFDDREIARELLAELAAGGAGSRSSIGEAQR